MSQRDDERFRVRPGPPKGRQQRFVSRVLKEASKAGGGPLRSSPKRSGAKFGRGHAAARFAGGTLGPRARRVVIKTRLVNLKKAGARSTEAHLRYIERDGVSRSGEPGQAYGPTTEQADLKTFEERGRGDRHQFRLIVGPEDAEQLDDLRAYTRDLMARMEADLGTRLDWVAVDHWDTDNPHTHIVLRGKEESGRDLVIAREYIAHGMRHRASEVATEWLGPRTELEIRQSQEREVEQERWTGLDRALQRQVQDGVIQLDRPGPDVWAQRQRTFLLGRLQRLERLGLAQQHSPGVWSLRSDAEPILRAMGERGDILRSMQRAMGESQRELVVSAPGENAQPVIGRVAGKGLADELQERGYLVVDGIDGRAHYVVLGADVKLGDFPVGGIVEMRPIEARAVDRTITSLAENGVYRTGHHAAILRATQSAELVIEDALATHVRRLEALRRAGVVERVADGIWRVPADLLERGRQYDAQRQGSRAVGLRSHLPIERQTRAIGATWLDRQLVGDSGSIADKGFGGEVREALKQRTEFLVEQGLAEQRGQRLVLTRNLLTTLRNRDIQVAAKSIAAETGLAHRPVADGDRVTGIYRRSVLLVSGRYAMLDDGLSFSLVPWRPVIEQRIGQTLTAMLRGGGSSWEIGRAQGIGRT